MIAVDTLVTFLLASGLLALAPGPDNLFVLTQSVVQGHKAGLLVTLGLGTGLIVHTAAVVLGVATVFQSSALAFNLLKMLGAAYLLVLAWQAFAVSAASLNAAGSNTLSASRLYRRGIIMNVTNPKVAIFFLAFLPQFVSPDGPPVAAQMTLLGGLFILVTLIVFGAIALLAGTLCSWLTHTPKVQIRLNRIAGVVFAGLAIKLASATIGS